MIQQKTYNVTYLTHKQRRKLVDQCMAQYGFKGIIKNQTNQPTNPLHLPIPKLKPPTQTNPTPKNNPAQTAHASAPAPSINILTQLKHS
jgi:hypothetical protein